MWKLLLIVMPLIFFFRFELINSNDRIVTLIAKTLFDYGLMAVFILLTMHYIDLWHKATSRRINKSYYAVTGVIGLFWASMYNFDAITDDLILISVMAVTGILFFIFGAKLQSWVTSTLPLREQDKKLLLRFPPRTRKDIIMMDIILISALAMPALFEMIIWN